jgi:hypothetical protein
MEFDFNARVFTCCLYNLSFNTITCSSSLIFTSDYIYPHEFRLIFLNVANYSGPNSMIPNYAKEFIWATISIKLIEFVKQISWFPPRSSCNRWAELWWLPLCLCSQHPFSLPPATTPHPASAVTVLILCPFSLGVPPHPWAPTSLSFTRPAHLYLHSLPSST